MQGRFGKIQSKHYVRAVAGIETHHLLVFIDGKLKLACQHLSYGACLLSYKHFLERYEGETK